MKRFLVAAALLLTVAACARKDAVETAPAGGKKEPAAPAAIAPVATEAPAGRYALDASHASLVFTIDHIGFSNYTGNFTRFGADLDFDPADSGKMAVTANIDLTSLAVPAPPEGFLAELLTAPWLDAAGHPTAIFRSTGVELLDADSARLSGDLDFRGVTAPVEMTVDFNGGFAGLLPYQPQARIGFSARGALRRAAFGMMHGLPPPGSTMGVGDEVKFFIEAEFTGPPLEPAPVE